MNRRRRWTPDRIERELIALHRKGKTWDEAADIVRRKMPESPYARLRRMALPLGYTEEQIMEAFIVTGRERIRRMIAERQEMLRKRNERSYASIMKAARTRRERGWYSNMPRDKATGKFVRRPRLI